MERKPQNDVCVRRQITKNCPVEYGIFVFFFLQFLSFLKFICVFPFNVVFFVTLGFWYTTRI